MNFMWVFFILLYFSDFILGYLSNLLFNLFLTQFSALNAIFSYAVVIRAFIISLFSNSNHFFREYSTMVESKALLEVFHRFTIFLAFAGRIMR